jgi:hypothetical protein
MLLKWFRKSSLNVCQHNLTIFQPREEHNDELATLIKWLEKFSVECLATKLDRLSTKNCGHNDELATLLK